MWAKLPKVLRTAIVAAAYIALWQLCALAAGSELKLPGPLSVLQTLLQLGATAVFWGSVGMTLLRVLAGFFLGLAAGTLLGALTAASPVVAEFLSPLRSIVRATPVSSFILLVLLYFTTGLTPVLIGFLMVTPVVWENVSRAAAAVDTQLLEMAQVFKLSRGKRLMYIFAPEMLPQYIAGATTGLGFAWKSAVAAEVIASPALSIGRGLMASKLYLETPGLFAWTAAVVILSMLLEKVVIAALRRLA